MQASVIARYRDEVAVKTNQWSAGTFGCFDNMGVCVVAFLLPCVSFGKTAEALGESACMHAGLWYWIPFLRHYFLSRQRAQLRHIRGIPGSRITDVLCHVACHPCSLAQEAVEAQRVREDIVTALAARGQQVVVQGNMITTMTLNAGHGHSYFPGMEPGGEGARGLEYQPDTYLHDMTPGPSLPPETDNQLNEQQQQSMQRY